MVDSQGGEGAGNGLLDMFRNACDNEKWWKFVKIFKSTKLIWLWWIWHLSKCAENSMEDMNTVVGVERFKTHLHPQGLQRNQVQAKEIFQNISQSTCWNWIKKGKRYVKKTQRLLVTKSKVCGTTLICMDMYSTL